MKNQHGPQPTEKTIDQSLLDFQIFEGHSGAVVSVLLMPDGEHIVSGSQDGILKIWSLKNRACIRTMKALDPVLGLAVTPNGSHILSGHGDGRLRIWEPNSGKCSAKINAHTDFLSTVAVTHDGQRVVTGSWDRTIRTWSSNSMAPLVTMKGHTDAVNRLVVTPDGKYVISASDDSTARVWNLRTGDCISLLEGHTEPVLSVLSCDNNIAITCSRDRTLKVWNLAVGACLATFEGHTESVNTAALTLDGQRVISGSSDGMLKVWDLASGTCLGSLEGQAQTIWSLVMIDAEHVLYAAGDKIIRELRLPSLRLAKIEDSARYTNAKIVLVGRTGAGKTGLALRLTERRWEPTESTFGLGVRKLDLPPDPEMRDLEREIWLWDFAGQPDYRLIHQLFMDETALGLLVFDPQEDNPFEEVGYWDKALAVAGNPASKILVAARCDRGGVTVSDAKLERFCQEHGITEFIETSAKTGKGCPELVDAITKYIPWDRLPWTSTSALFKDIREGLIKIKNDISSRGASTVLFRMSELCERLQSAMGLSFEEQELRAVVGLLSSQGLVQVLSFGDFILLQPEQLNIYASAVIRVAREHIDEIGCVRELDVLEARIDFKDMRRLRESDERILLRAVTQTFLGKALCLRQETPAGEQLVFPSHFRRDKPDLPDHPSIFLTYGFLGPVDEIYATLVVRLHYSDLFELKDLWKDAADFVTPSGKRVGLKLDKKEEGKAEITVYFEPGVPDDTRVSFLKYIHEHLLRRARDVSRVRSYVCPHCNESVEGTKAIQRRIQSGLSSIVCQFCEEEIPLFDLIEKKFASDVFLRKAREMDEQADINLDKESLELILVGHAFAIAAEAGQIFRPTPNSDWGIDGEIEFKDHRGQASGRRVYLQLKSGDSHLSRRKGSGKEVFTIKNPRHATYWREHAYPVMLVIRTSDGVIRWMNVTDYLKERGPGRVGSIVFEGESFTASNVLRLRDSTLMS